MERSAEAIASGGVHGFPAALTSFVGRAGPLGEVAGLLAECRLVTVTGPGGSGKTRLAAELARRVAGEFADGVWLAELATAADPELVASAVAVVLGIPEQPGVPAAEAVARVLAGRQLLLVLDNCEHVVGAAAGLCAKLLSACDELKILATSREPLAVAGEARYRLAPLALPDLDDLAAAARAEAVTLFADRARRADARFALTGDTTSAVARLVARLDGMPLAIELAAARVEALGVTQLLDRLDDRFALLDGADRAAPSRQRSLAATVDWSYRLLDDQQQRVFRAVSVFPGPFTLAGAEAVAGAGAERAVLRLVDCSLLVPPRVGVDGRYRYGMLETLRAYGSRLLEDAGERDGAAAAMAGYALAVAEQVAAGLQTRTGEQDAARWLDAEDATVRQALAWAAGHDLAVALRLVAALGWWWYLRGRLPGQYELLGEVAGRAEPGSDGWCTAQSWLGWAASSADYDVALGHFTVLRDAVAGRAPSLALADALVGRSVVLLNMGRVPEGVGDGRRALVLARQLGYPVAEARALTGLSMAASTVGDHDDAVRLARQAAQVTAGVPPALARSRSHTLSLVLEGAGDPAASEYVAAAGLAQAREAGDVWTRAALLPRMAYLDLEAGRMEAAAAHLQEALQVGVRNGDWGETLIKGLDASGTWCAATGRQAEALTLWAAAEALLRHQRSVPPPWAAARMEEMRRAARQALDPGQTRAAEDRGAAMGLAAAVEYALMLTAPGPVQSPGGHGLVNLTARERELVTLVARGYMNAQIATELLISLRTVSSHLDRIRDKTGCRRRADLTRLALTAGLV